MITEQAASDWLFNIRQEYFDLHEEKIRLLEDESPSRPALQKALLNKTERLIETAEKKLAIANYVSKIVEELDHGKVTVVTAGLVLEFEW
jgi:hypothetical protein